MVVLGAMDPDQALQADKPAHINAQSTVSTLVSSPTLYEKRGPRHRSGNKPETADSLQAEKTRQPQPESTEEAKHKNPEKENITCRNLAITCKKWPDREENNAQKKCTIFISCGMGCMKM